MQYLGPKIVTAGTLTLTGLHARGIALVPDKDAVGEYPLQVDSANGQKLSDVERILGPSSWEPGYTLEEAEISVANGGGADGDVWHLYADREFASTVERFRRNGAGYLQTAPADPVVLFDHEVTDERTLFIDAFEGQGDGTWYITPDDRTFQKHTAGKVTQFKAWDLSRYPNFALIIDQQAEEGLVWTFKPFVDLTYAADGNKVKRFEAGTVGNFGSLGADPWSALEPGAIILGPQVTTLENFVQSSPMKLTHARIGFAVTNNIDPTIFSNLLPGFESLRILAIQW